MTMKKGKKSYEITMLRIPYFVLFEEYKLSL